MGATNQDPNFTSPDPLNSAQGQSAADRLQRIMEASKSWPIWSADGTGGLDTGTYAQAGSYGKSLRDIALWIALRENDRSKLIELTNWQKDRPIHVDPLAERISTAYSDLLYGEIPEFVAAAKPDQDNMDEMTKEMALDMELKRYADIFVSEGECWWRIWTDPDASEWPLISGHSRINVVPLFAGRKVIAVAFVDNFTTQEIKVENSITQVFWRHIEIHAKGHVRNLLYRGSMGALGVPVPLSSMPDTEHLEAEWDHGLPLMLAGRFINKLGRDHRLGVSEYQGVRDMLMDLTEARTIMAENARLVLKARMVVPADAVDANGDFDASQDLIKAETLDEELGRPTNGPYTVLEYNFPSDKLIMHKSELTLDILARVGLAEQYGQQSRGGSGEAFTGTALRTRLVPTVQAASGKGRAADREAPKILRAAAMVSSLPPEEGGCGVSWEDANGKHIQKRANLLPEDPNEEVQRHVMAVQGEIESIWLSVATRHPDWEEADVTQEVSRILDDRRMVTRGIGAPENPDDPQLPPKSGGGPGSAVPTPGSLLGASQANGKNGTGSTPPHVKAGGKL